MEGLELPSLNTWQRMHWTARRRLKDAVKTRVFSASIRAGAPRAEQRRATVTVNMVRKRRIMDADNLFGSLKALMDALVYYGILEDDSMEWIDVTITQEPRRGRPVSVTVEIEYEEANK
jgi:hypothetical protein